MKYILALILLTSAAGIAWAQGLSMGLGIGDIPTMQGNQGAPAVIGFLLLETGGNILLEAGGKVQCETAC